MAQSERQAAANKQKRKQTPTGTRKNELTTDRWKIYLQYIANGATRAEASRAAQVSQQTVQAYLIAEPTAIADIRTAERAWIRRDWPIERIEDFLVLVAMGKTNIDAAAELEWMEGELDQLMKIILHDEGVRNMYDEARKLQMETWGDEMIEIADEATNDTYESTDRSGNSITKTDHEVIGRSKIRIQTRQWLMSRLHHERFGDRIQQDISGELNVNHADLLDMARKRRERAKQNAEELRPNAVKEDSTDQIVVH